MKLFKILSFEKDSVRDKCHCCCMCIGYRHQQQQQYVDNVYVYVTALTNLYSLPQRYLRG